MVEQERSGSRVRARLVRLGAPRTPQHQVLGPLLRTVRATHPKADVTLIERAYAVAERAHRGQTRKSGDPYITHPLAVANILAELGMDTTTLIAALLHDTVEDTGYTLEALTQEFGTEVGHLVDGVPAGADRGQGRPGMGQQCRAGFGQPHLAARPHQ